MNNRPTEDRVVLSASKLNVFRGHTQVLKDINLQLRQGEILSLIGPNGAGKSSLLLALSGLLPAKSGEISFNDNGDLKTLNKLSTDKIVDMGIIHCPEGRQVFSRMTVEENLLLGAYRIDDTKTIEAGIALSYDLFPVLHERRKQLAGLLSGGEQMMLAISRSLLSAPKLLMLDEPSLGLAPQIVDQIFEIFEKINQTQNISILLVEQNATLALEVAHRAAVLEQGRLSEIAPSEVLINDADIISKYLGI